MMRVADQYCRAGISTIFLIITFTLLKQSWANVTKTDMTETQKTSQVGCPLENFSTLAFFNHHNPNIAAQISLNISWTKHIDTECNSVNMSIMRTDSRSDCFQLSWSIFMGFRKTYVIKPLWNDTPTINVLPNCAYRITFKPNCGGKCEMDFKVPDCVGDDLETRICDCRQRKPAVKILNVFPARNSSIYVKWQPGCDQQQQNCAKIKLVNYYYGKKIINDSDHNFTNHISRLKVPKFEVGKEYIISGEFINEYNCRSRVDYKYLVPECVGDDLETGICDCRQRKPVDKILKVIPDQNSSIYVKWLPGCDQQNDANCGKITSVNYYYSKKLRHTPISINNGEHNFTTHMSKLKMPIRLEDGEEYVIHGEFINEYNCISLVDFPLSVPKDRTVMIVGYSTVGGVIILVCAYLSHRFRFKLRAMKIRAIEACYNEREQSRLVNLPLTHFTENSFYTPEIPECDKFEFPREKLEFKEFIDEGCFGKVYLAKAFAISGIAGYQMVAVKTLGDDYTTEDLKEFLAEIEIFKKVGNHENIIKLLGCCTLRTPYMIIMELAPCGSLKEYLFSLRKDWKEYRARQVFFPMDSDGVYIDPPNSTDGSSSPMISTPSTIPCEDVPSTPSISEYNRSLRRRLDHKELQNFALQIAKGMAHLESIPITHRDLAARNVLINEYRTLKISDFGMSRQGIYINQKRKRVPIRWNAPESIKTAKYDSKSDVWSFGVVLWEIATLGARPYDDIDDNFLMMHLENGTRLAKPEVCTEEMYSLMCKCWHSEPEKRPTFAELCQLLSTDKRKVYVDFNQLNPTYIFPPGEVAECWDLEDVVQVKDMTK